MQTEQSITSGNTHVLKPRKALNKAFLKVKPNRSQIEQFKGNLIQLLDRTNDIESEEFHKNLVTDFLKKTYYEPNHFINTKGRNDLVIHNGNKAKSNVGVIIEAKKPTNQGEMLSREKINVKAFQELVLYYLRERITHKNLEVKYLIATNIYEWFIFDANIFEKAFAQNKKLVTQFMDFEGGRLAGKTTDFFYKEIAEPFISEMQQEVEYTYFDIRNYEKPLRNNNPKDDNKLIALFKLLSPEHLLKLPFTNDSNSLDKRFYGELLHIIGLTETKQGGKKLIERQKEGQRNTGSFLENAIIQLDSTDKIGRLENPSQFGNTQQERLFNVGLELSITWLNRILFLKLLEAQLLTYQKGDKSYEFLSLDRITNYDDLNSLFFQVLGRKPSERNEDVKTLFEKVPYLNSSLFEPTDIEHSTLFISNLRDDKTLPIYSATVLKDEKGKKRSGELNALEYLFEFLNAYDFSSEGGESIQEDNKTLINASVLGLIFEKINGYKDGSFFTPGFITMYMCRETIRKAVVQKFNEAKGWDCKNLDQLYDLIEDRKEANELINSLKICDPAVGSGHFLVSALNEIIAIKNDLNILQDRNGRRLKEYHVEVVNDELIVTDEDGELFEYNPTSKESQRVQEAMFHEKQTIIENCLFGVDINPNSVKICRLRLWIELLKSAYYKWENNNTSHFGGGREGELETLPNIDINIKCGNSLISRFDLDADLSKALKESKWNIESYRNAVDTYRNAQSKEEKREMEKIIHDIKNDFRSEISGNDPKVKRLQKVKGELFLLTNQTQMFEMSKREKAAWNKKLEKLSKESKKFEAEIREIKDNKIYENAFEWRFEFPEVLNEKGDYVGFDVVIGNPPYIYNRDLDLTQRNFLKVKFKQADDLYVYFTYEGFKILNPNGYLTLITPNTYFTLSSREAFRDFLLNQSSQKFTYSGFCFEDAYVETMILSFKAISKENSKVLFIPEPEDYYSYQEFETSSNILKGNINKRFFIPTEFNLKLLSKINQWISPLFDQFPKKLAGFNSYEDDLKEHIYNLKKQDITLLGLISEGEQGLVTGNNSRYIAQITNSEEDCRKINFKFLEELKKHGFHNLTISELEPNLEKFYQIAENLKVENQKPEIFGKFFIYKTQNEKKVISFKDLPKEAKSDGAEVQTWVNYYKGNTDGLRWRIPYNECIAWSKEAVDELREGVVTNSRWQGHKFFDTTGFAWVDYFTTRIKAFFVDEGIYSKNIVKLHSNLDKAPDKFIVALLNSSFISYYIKNFITSTHTLQINDGRLIPIIIPSHLQLQQLLDQVDMILEIKKENPAADTSSLEAEIDRLVYDLYALTEEEIAIVEGLTH